MISSIAAWMAISSQSLWIDEANSAMKAISPSWSDFIARMSIERGSDLQMPGYMTALWLWVKAFGHSELALRALNAPLYLGAISIVVFNLKASLRTRLFFVLFSSSSAFIWAYLDEARPYILQFSGASIAMVGLYNISISAYKNLQIADAILATLGLIVLLAASLSTIFFVTLLGLTFLVLLLRLMPLRMILSSKIFSTSLVLAFLACIALVFYYHWTLIVGAKASSVGKTTPMSMIFCMYELAGCIGIGPGRGDLRDHPFESLKNFTLPLGIYLSVFITFIILTLYSIYSAEEEFPRTHMLILIALFLAIIMVFLLGITERFRVVGRHLMPAFPFFILMISIGADLIIKRFKSKGIILVGLTLVVGLVSSLEIRIAARHRKDDYRAAAQIAQKAISQGKIVWWAADSAGAEYYGLQKVKGLVMNPLSVLTEKKTYIDNKYNNKVYFPDVIILSKKDIYDSSGLLIKWIKENGFEIIESATSFSFYNKKQI